MTASGRGGQVSASGRLEPDRLLGGGHSWLRQLRGNRYGRSVPSADCRTLEKLTLYVVNLRTWASTVRRRSSGMIGWGNTYVSLVAELWGYAIWPPPKFQHEAG